MSYPLVLTLDMAGLPFRWVEMEDAIMYAARNMVAWSIGSEAGVFRGGLCRATGKRSIISTKCIIALKGSDKVVHDLSRPPLLSRETLFARDRHVCAYCGGKYRERELSKDHVIPLSKKAATIGSTSSPRAGHAIIARPIARRSRRAWNCFTCRTRRIATNTSFCKTATSSPTRWNI